MPMQMIVGKLVFALGGAFAEHLDLKQQGKKPVDLEITQRHILRLCIERCIWNGLNVEDFVRECQEIELSEILLRQLSIASN